MKNFFLALLLSLGFIACDEEVPQGPNFIDPNPNDVEIQVKNQSSFRLDSLFLNTSGGEQFYNQVNANSTSNFKSFSFSYPEMEIRFQVSGKDFSHDPGSYDGQEKVAFGEYELQILSVDTSNASFSFRLEEL